MKINCEAYNAVLTEKTCIARQAVIHHSRKDDKLQVSLCLTCKKGIDLYKKAGEPLPKRTTKYFYSSPKDRNHAWLNKMYSYTWVD